MLPLHPHWGAHDGRGLVATLISFPLLFCFGHRTGSRTRVDLSAKSSGHTMELLGPTNEQARTTQW